MNISIQVEVRMGNVMGNVSQHGKLRVEPEEWLEDLRKNQILDFSRKVTHSQFIKHVQNEYTESSLTDVPWTILEEINLFQELDGSFNNISHLSTNLALRIPHITHLNFSYNSITEIPSSIALLFHLKELLLRENKLVCLPEELCLLKKLQMLDVSHNQLQTLPKEIGKLLKLTKLNVSHNYLTVLPHCLGLIPHLSVLVATHNRCVDPPQEICNRSSQLLIYLRQHAPEELPFKKLNFFPRVRSNVARSQLDNSARTQSVASYVQTLTQTTKPSSRAKTPLLLPIHATQCSADEFTDKIIGMVYGAVLGDTLGVATEYLMPDEILFYYGNGRLSHSRIVQDEHRSHFQRGKTTCVSDFSLLIFDSIIQWSGVVDELELARRLVDYSKRGLMNEQPLITSSIVNRLFSHDKFTSDPHAVAAEIANNFDATICEDLNALPMAVMSGLPQFYNLVEVQSNAARVCKTTHNHQRIVKSSALLATVVAMLLQGNQFQSIQERIDCDNLLDNRTNGSTLPASKDQEDELSKLIDSALLCLERSTDFETGLTDILFQGGQSRIYGSVCGAILGCRFGFARMPLRWLEGLHPSVKEWLNDRLNHLLDMMGLP